MGHIMREDKKLKNPKNNTGNQSDTPLALSWDTLPDLAKNRWEEAVAFAWFLGRYRAGGGGGEGNVFKLEKN